MPFYTSIHAPSPKKTCRKIFWLYLWVHCKKPLSHAEKNTFYKCKKGACKGLNLNPNSAVRLSLPSRLTKLNARKELGIVGPFISDLLEHLWSTLVCPWAQKKRGSKFKLNPLFITCNAGTWGERAFYFLVAVTLATCKHIEHLKWVSKISSGMKSKI